MKKVVPIALLALLISSSNLLAEGFGGKKALIASAVLPGTGEYLLGYKTKGTMFLTADALIFFSIFRLNQEIKWQENSFQQFAYRNAGVPKGASDDYYRLIGNYVNSDKYNDELEMYIRNRFLIYENNPELYQAYRDQFLIIGEDRWEWNNKDNWLQYRKLRKDKQQMDIYVNFAIGAAVINRLVSVIDTAMTIKHSNTKKTILSNVNVVPDFQKMGYSLTYEYAF